MSETVTRADIERAIAICEEGRRSHVSWATYLRNTPGAPSEIVEAAGDVDEHEEWIAHYDHVLRVLRAMTGGEA